MNDEHKTFAIYLMKRLALSDSTFQMNEQAFIDLASRYFELDRAVVENIDPDDFNVQRIPAFEKDRMTILYYVLFLAEVDGVILPDEKDEIRKIGFELGFRDDQIVQMIQVIEEHKNKVLDPEVLIEIIRSGLN